MRQAEVDVGERVGATREDRQVTAPKSLSPFRQRATVPRLRRGQDIGGYVERYHPKRGSRSVALPRKAGQSIASTGKSARGLMGGFPPRGRADMHPALRGHACCPRLRASS